MQNSNAKQTTEQAGTPVWTVGINLGGQHQPVLRAEPGRRGSGRGPGDDTGEAAGGVLSAPQAETRPADPIAPKHVPIPQAWVRFACPLDSSSPRQSRLTFPLQRETILCTR